MNKGLLYSLLFVFSVSALVLSPHTYAEDTEATSFHYEKDDKDDVDVVIYPNPAEENIFVRLDLIDPTFIDNSEIELEIRNILGNSMPVESERIDASRFRVVTADYPSGYYLLIVHCRACGENNRSSKNVFKFLRK